MLNQIKKFLRRKKWYFEKKIYKLGKKYKKIKLPSSDKIKTIVFDTTNYHTEMCEISIKLIIRLLIIVGITVIDTLILVSITICSKI